MAGVVSLSWMTIVTLTPAADRPYVDGSQHNSVYEQVFVYNGFGRTSQQPAFQQFLGGIHLSPEIINGPPPAWNRLVQGDLGRDTGWLLPAALAVGVGGLFTRRRSYFILWTGWLVPMVAVFSDVFIFHSYYTAGTLATDSGDSGRRDRQPVGIQDRGASRGSAPRCGRRPDRGGNRRLWHLADPIIWGERAGLAVAAGGLAGAVAVVLLLASAVAWSRRALLAAALIVGMAAVLVVPASGTAQIVAKQRGFGDTPFESAKTAATNAALLGSSSKGLGSFLPTLEKLQMGSPYVMAVYTSAVASEFISATGKEILPIGGFSGTIPEPTISQLEAMIRAGKFHLALLIGEATTRASTGSPLTASTSGRAGEPPVCSSVHRTTCRPPEDDGREPRSCHCVNLAGFEG